MLGSHVIPNMWSHGEAAIHKMNINMVQQSLSTVVY